MRSNRVVAGAVALTTLLAAGACGKHYLRDYQFADRTIGVIFIDPPEPELLHGWYDLDVGHTITQTVVRAGATVAKEVVADRAAARLDSASARVDVATLLAGRTLDRASRYLGTRPVSALDSSDFLMEVRMESFGIDARSSNATYLFVEAEAVLIDRQTGREIWSEDVRGRERLTAYVIGTPNVPSAILSAATLHTVSVEDFERALNQLVRFTSDLITDELREKLRDVREK